MKDMERIEVTGKRGRRRYKELVNNLGEIRG
jgi:hypothetical protein